MNYIKKDLGIRYINNMLNKKIRDFYTYNKLINKELGIKSNIPIYIDSKCLLLPIKTFKAFDCIWINYYEIVSYNKHDNDTIIVFRNNEVSSFDIRYGKMKRIVSDGLKIIEYFKNMDENK